MWTGGTHGRRRKECGEARYIEKEKIERKKMDTKLVEATERNEGKREPRQDKEKRGEFSRKKGCGGREKNKWRGGEGE